MSEQLREALQGLVDLRGHGSWSKKWDEAWDAAYAALSTHHAAPGAPQQEASGAQPIGHVRFVAHRKAPDVEWAANVEIHNGAALYTSPRAAATAPNLERGMQALMARLSSLLDEDQFKDCEDIVRKAGVAAPAGGVTDEREAFERANLLDLFGKVPNLRERDLMWQAWQVRAAFTTAARAAEPAIHLGAEGQKVFAETLLNPPPPTAAFLKAEESYSNLVRPEATAPAGGVTDWPAEAKDIADAIDSYIRAAVAPDWDNLKSWRNHLRRLIAESSQAAALTPAARAAEPDMVQQCMAIINAAWAAIPEPLRVDDGTDPTGNPLPAAVRALAARAAEPEGWKLVPIEPTSAMIEAGASADPERESVWAAYLAASPTPPTGTSQGEGEK